jgi:alpha-tubulin suppressor-like RCC1 family protein
VQNIKRSSKASLNFSFASEKAKFVLAHRLAGVVILSLFCACSQHSVSPNTPNNDLDFQIVRQPSSDTVSLGQKCTLSIIVKANLMPEYQWQHDGENISGANSANYLIIASQYQDSGEYRVIIKNEHKIDTSDIAMIHVIVLSKITISKQPINQVVTVGEACTLSVAVDDSFVYSFQWYKSGVKIEGAFMNTYVIDAAFSSVTGEYAVQISNSSAGSMKSKSAMILVVPKVSAGSSHTLLLKPDGSCWSYGSDKHGQLGDGAEVNRIAWFRVLDSVKFISAGSLHSMAIKTDGSLWAWGYDHEGQLTGPRYQAAKLYPLMIMTDVKEVTAGSSCSFRIKLDGTLWSCGNNFFGKLGVGDTLSKEGPVEVMSDIRHAAGGANHSFALKEDRTLWGWGSNSVSQIGAAFDGTILTPELVMNNVQCISTRLWFSLVVKDDGSMWAFGNNQSGQFGNGTFDDSYSDSHLPTQIMENVKDVSAGLYHSLILKTDRTVWVCGSTINGKELLPVKVMEDVKSISAGGYHNLVVKNDGTVWSWGENSYGQLCDGTTVGRLTPKQIFP